MSEKTRVLVVDDSALVRKALSDILSATVDIEVVATAPNPFVARDKVKRLAIDVITLDIEMPRMDGLTFLEKLLRFKPIPVVMISSLTQKGADATLKALSLGAVDFVSKPGGALGIGLEEQAAEIVRKVRGAATARVQLRPRSPHRSAATEGPPTHDKLTIDGVLPLHRRLRQGKRPIVCIGASTGGTVALERLLSSLPAQMPGIAVVQHMPAAFTRSFAARLDAQCQLEVLEAQPGMPLTPGRVIVACGADHLLLQRAGTSYYVERRDGPPVNRHKPSVDMLFRSAANTAGAAVLGVLLTGMGDDGARGLKDLRDAGAHTIAQDEASCVVFGMPRVAIELGAAAEVASLDAIPRLLVERLSRGQGTRTSTV